MQLDRTAPACPQGPHTPGLGCRSPRGREHCRGVPPPAPPPTSWLRDRDCGWVFPSLPEAVWGLPRVQIRGLGCKSDTHPPDSGGHRGRLYPSLPPTELHMDRTLGTPDLDSVVTKISGQPLTQRLSFQVNRRPDHSSRQPQVDTELAPELVPTPHCALLVTARLMVRLPSHGVFLLQVPSFAFFSVSGDGSSFLPLAQA